MFEQIIATPADMEALGAQLAPGLSRLRLVGLSGELGTGKTTLVRGMLRALGCGGTVRSPTFTLVEPYELGGGVIYHIDLYRMKHPGELENLGIRDFLDSKNVCLVEWPERGAGVLPEADIDVIIRFTELGRTVQIVSHTETGAAVIGGLS